MVFFVLFIDKSYVNAECRNVGEKLVRHLGISSGSHLPQSGIGIPAAGFSPVPLVTD
jgi:hypothetical protein